MNKIHGFSWTGLNYGMAEEMVDKINELVNWINKHDKLLKSTMQEAIQLMIEDMKREKHEKH